MTDYGLSVTAMALIALVFAVAVGLLLAGGQLALPVIESVLP